jgi:hypothetical protein
MALTNCTLNSGTLVKIGGQVVDNNSATDLTLTITPDQHFSVKASDFTTGSLPSSISTITFADTDIPGSFENTVSVNIDLNDSYTMPNSDTVVNLNITGAAVKGEVITKAIYLLDREQVKSNTQATVTTVNGSGITVSSGSTVGDYYHRTATGSEQIGSRVLLFTKTFTAATDYYYPIEPDFSITSAIREHPELYEVEVEKTYLENGRYDRPLQVVQFKVYYNVPSYDVIAGDLDTITFTAETVQIFDAGRKINRVTFPAGDIPQRGGNKVVAVYGVPGAAYTLTIGSSQTHIAVQPTNYTNQVIPAVGYQSHNFLFGSSYVGNTYTDITYNLNIAAASSNPATTIDYTNIPNTNPTYTILQRAAVTLILNRTSTTGFSYTTPSSEAVVAMPGYLTPDKGESITNFDWQFNVTKTGGGNVFVRRQPEYDSENQTLSDFSNSVASSNSGYVLDATKEALGSGTATVTIKIIGEVDFGTTNKTMTLDLDNIINTPPLAYAQSSVNVANNTATNITLTGTDHNSDPLTYSIVSQGSKGTATVNSSTGAAVYTPTSALSTGADQFSYKVNDGYEDSAPQNVGLIIASGGSTGITFNSLWTWDDTEDSSPAAPIGGIAFTGEATYTGATAGASSFTATFLSWDLDSTHTGLPSYVDYFGDIVIRWELKYSGTQLSTGLAVINTGTSSLSQSNQTGTININSVTVSIPSSHNSGNGMISGGGYTFVWGIEYTNISQ